MIDLSFLGGAGTVTGSKYLLSWDDRKVMVDCGLFQGLKKLRMKNWAPLDVEPKDLDAVFLTHAHLDHSGYLPLLVRQGFSGPIFCTSATKDLCEILLRDSAFLQEKDAEFANRHGFSKHRPALPLYTQKDAELALKAFRIAEPGEKLKVLGGLDAQFFCAGHILGASMIRLSIKGRRILFSGDLGRMSDPVMPRPAPMPQTDYLIIESTYGNRKHEPVDIENELAGIISQTAGRGGKVIVPAFAVGRTQSLLYHLQQLKRKHMIPDLPIFLDSPMAINASELYCRHGDAHRLTNEECRAACNIARYTRDVEDSKALASLVMPAVIISASGMATGGRVLHHLKHFVGDRRNTLLFTGFQAAGTRGRAIVEGAQHVKIHGKQIAIAADVKNLEALSAHADGDEILDWIRCADHAPNKTFVTHGEQGASEALASRLASEFGWRCSVPELGQKEVLS